MNVTRDGRRFIVTTDASGTVTRIKERVAYAPGKPWEGVCDVQRWAAGQRRPGRGFYADLMRQVEATPPLPATPRHTEKPGDTMTRHPEHQYLDLLRELLDAPARETRNDTATRSVFGRQMRFDLSRGFPLLTTKKLPFRWIVLENLWFMSGSTNARWLEDQGVTIWKQWGDPETREMGPIYGAQMRRSLGARDHWVVETDQVATVLRGLRDDPYGRRHVMTLWNSAQIDQMALPPCHGIAIQFYVGADERLSCQMYQRSADVFLGLPWNIAGYSLLTMMFASALNRLPGEFVWVGGDTHLYGNHEEQARQQILREPRPFPLLAMAHREDLDGWSLGDFCLSGYEPWPGLPAEVSA